MLQERGGLIRRMPDTLVDRRVAKGAVRRVSDLESVPRFHEHPVFIHRNNLFDHSLRVSAIGGEIASFLVSQGIPVNVERTRELGIIHDDVEVRTGDISKKRKLEMSERQAIRLKRKEDWSNKRLALRYYGWAPQNEGRQRYREDYVEASQKDTVEARSMNIGDKIEGVSETLLDIFSGNRNVLSVLDTYRRLFIDLNQTEPLLDKLNQDPNYYIGPDAIPTDEEVLAFPQINPTLYREHEDVFWSRVLNPRLPGFYRTWMNNLLTQPSLTPFPGWPSLPSTVPIHFIQPSLQNVK